MQYAKERATEKMIDHRCNAAKRLGSTHERLVTMTGIAALMTGSQLARPAISSLTNQEPHKRNNAESDVADANSKLFGSAFTIKRVDREALTRLDLR
jgi:hypothetical protein